MDIEARKKGRDSVRSTASKDLWTSEVASISVCASPRVSEKLHSFHFRKVAVKIPSRNHVSGTSAVSIPAGGCNAGKSSGPAWNKEVGMDCIRPAEQDKQASKSILMM